MLRFSITYTGHVQGVGFRVTARHLARDFAVSGWVKNQPNGSVLLEVQGDADQITLFRESIRSALGRGIRTEHAHDLPLLPAETGFTIR